MCECKSVFGLLRRIGYILNRGYPRCRCPPPRRVRYIFSRLLRRVAYINPQLSTQSRLHTPIRDLYILPIGRRVEANSAWIRHVM
jgi:hypothetical protein